jgi:hypothetical protein
MSPAAKFFWMAVGVTLGHQVEIALGRSITVSGAAPRLGMAAVAVACLHVGPNAGAALGALLGALETSYLALFSGSLIVSRAVTGFAMGYLDEWLFRGRLAVAIAFGFLAVLVADSLFFLFAPQPNAAAWWRTTVASAIYTGFAAALLHLAVQHLANKQRL